MTIQELKAAFVYTYQQKADAVYFVPGRIYLLGELIAEIENVDLQPTFSFGIYLLLLKNNDGYNKLWSLNEPV